MLCIYYKNILLSSCVAISMVTLAVLQHCYVRFYSYEVRDRKFWLLLEPFVRWTSLRVVAVHTLLWT
jgi:hypothetical protein